jgi:fimbrial isopeptide formation D2 family protein
VLVHKRWRVTTAEGTTDYPNGSQPFELQAALTLTGPDDPAPTPQNWDEPRSGYSAPTSVDIGETIDNARIPECILTASTIEAGAPDATAPGTGTVFTGTSTQDVVAGDNEWTITNAVRCSSFLTLRKTVSSGSASPDSWNLTGIGAAGALPGPSGTTGSAEATRVEVSPGELYQLAEAVTPGNETLTKYYAQTDLRTRPLQFPLSTGSWNCELDGLGDRVLSETGIEGAIAVPLGQAVTCTADNNISTLTVIKEVNGGTAQPSDFTFHLQPLDRVGVDPGGIDVAGGPAPAGNTIQVTPLRHYQLTEVSGPPGYQLDDLTCSSGIRSFTPNDIFAEPGGSITCVATNSFTEWTYFKTSDPPSGSVVQPGDIVTYTVTAQQTAGAPTTDVVITDDLSDVLDDATLVDGSIQAQAGTAVFTPPILTWTIPSLSGTVTLTYQVTVNPGAWNTTLRNVAGGITGENVPADPCDPATPDCRVTVETTPPQPTPPQPGAPAPGEETAGGPLAGTGSDIVPPLVALLVAVGVGGGLVMISRRRRRNS